MSSNVEQFRAARYAAVVDVHLMLCSADDESILMGLRSNTGFEDGKFHLPSGHLEDGETVEEALIRETKEELGIHIDPAEPSLVHVIHQFSGSGRLGFFFRVQNWLGDVRNMEPEKCAALRWIPLHGLPGNVVPYCAHALSAYANGHILSTYGWEQTAIQSAT